MRPNAISPSPTRCRRKQPVPLPSMHVMSQNAYGAPSRELGNMRDPLDEALCTDGTRARHCPNAAVSAAHRETAPELASNDRR